MLVSGLPTVSPFTFAVPPVNNSAFHRELRGLALASPRIYFIVTCVRNTSATNCRPRSATTVWPARGLPA